MKNYIKLYFSAIGEYSRSFSELAYTSKKAVLSCKLIAE